MIQSLKDMLGNSIMIIASSRNPEHAYKDVVDKFIVEDWEETGDEHNYINWLKKALVDNNVDMMFAKRHLNELYKHRDSLEQLGVTLCIDFDSIPLLNSKHRTLMAIQGAGLTQLIPKEVIIKRSFDNERSYFMEDTSNQMIKIDYEGLCNELNSLRGTGKTGIFTMCDMTKRSYEANKKEGKTPQYACSICIKTDSGEGGTSFRKISDEPVTFKSLNKFRVNTITTSELLDIIKSMGQGESIILMEQLDEPEISVDCYRSAKGFIAIARKKVAGTRVETIFINEQVRSICNKIADKLELSNIFNVQFRVEHWRSAENIDNWRLLEINPRMSGGAHYESAVGINLCAMRIADEIKKLDFDYKKAVDVLAASTGYKATYVEQAIKIKKD